MVLNFAYPEILDDNLVILPYAIVTVTLLSLFYLYYQTYLSSLASIPGPFWAKYSPFWMVVQQRRGDIHWTLISLHKKYGKIVRVGPNEV